MPSSVALSVLLSLCLLGASASSATTGEASTSPAGFLADLPVWNVQAFLPNVASYEREGYSIVRPVCTAGGEKSCSQWSTEPETRRVSDRSPVDSLDSIGCAKSSDGSVDCTAFGVSASGKPIEVKTTDSGLDWSFEALPSGIQTVASTSCPGAGVCYMAASRNDIPVVFETTDGGSKWRQVPIENDAAYKGVRLDSISCATELFCVAGGGLATNTRNGSFVAETPLVLSMTNPEVGFSMPSYKKMGPLCCQGSDWGGFAEPGLPSSIAAVSCGSVDSCWAFGGNDSGIGLSYAYSDTGGRSWIDPKSRFTLPPGAHGFVNVSGAEVQCSSRRDCQFGYAYDTGLGGPTPFEIYRTRDGGSSWNYEDLPSTVSDASAVQCTSASVCFAVGGGIASTSDGGAAWSSDVSSGSLTSDGVSSLGAVSCVSSDQCWAVGQGSYGGYILDTVTDAETPASGDRSSSGFSSLPLCAAGQLPEIGDPCRPRFALSGLSIAPSCWSGNTTDGASGAAKVSRRVEGESETLSHGRSIDGAWAVLSVAPMCRSRSGTPASSSVIVQDEDGSAFLQVGIRYLAPSTDDPNGEDVVFSELEDGGAGTSPRTYRLAGSESSSEPVPFTDVTWLDPLTGPYVEVGVTRNVGADGSVDYSVYLDAPPSSGNSGSSSSKATFLVTPQPTKFPFSGPAQFVYDCGTADLGPGGSCAEKSKGEPGPLDTVDLVASAASAGAEMPGSCTDPSNFSDVHLKLGSWAPVDVLPTVATNGASLAFDRNLGAWILTSSELSGYIPALSRAELFLQDGYGSGPGGGTQVPSAWQVQNNSPTPTSVGISMSDQPCDTWAGVPGG